MRESVDAVQASGTEPPFLPPSSGTEAVSPQWSTLVGKRGPKFFPMKNKQSVTISQKRNDLLLRVA